MADVKLIDQFPLYEMGGALRYLKDVCNQDTTNSYTQLFALHGARQHLQTLIGGEPISVSYCKGSAASLLELIKLHLQHFTRNEASPPEAPPPIEPWRLNRIKAQIEIFEHQFSAELKKTAIYAVPKRGIFDTEELVDAAEKHLPEAIHSILPGVATSEFRAAGRCLAFGLFSASGFHAMRAAESVLRNYYRMFKGEPSKKDLTMGLMASHLIDLTASTSDVMKPNPGTVRSIKDVTAFDRNPLMHPNIVLDETDATILFNRAQIMITDMAREIMDRRDEANQAPLPLEEATDALPAPTTKRLRKRTLAEGAKGAEFFVKATAFSRAPTSGAEGQPS